MPVSGRNSHNPTTIKVIRIKKMKVDPKEKAAENELLAKMKQKISNLDRKLSASKGLSSQARTLTEHNDGDYDNDEVKFGSEIGTEDQN